MGAWGQIASMLVGSGLDFVGQKYASDLDRRNARDVAEYETQANKDMFNLQKAENARIFKQNYDVGLQMWEKQKSYLDDVWDREKQYNLDMWNKQNEYNTPAQQMARLKAAGLNPNLMYQRGDMGNAAVIKTADYPTASAPRGAEVEPARAASSHLPYTAPGGRFDRLSKTILDYFGIRNADLQSKNLAAQNSLIEQQARVTEENARSLKRENDLLEGTGASRMDPSMWRFGGRVSKWLRQKWNEKSSIMQNYQIKFQDQENPKLIAPGDIVIQWGK